MFGLPGPVAIVGIAAATAMISPFVAPIYAVPVLIVVYYASG